MTYYTSGLGFDPSILTAILGLVNTGVKGGVELYGQYQTLEQAERSARTMEELVRLQLEAAKLKDEAVRIAQTRADTGAEKLQKATASIAVAGGAAALGLLLFLQ